ncbi:copper transport protein [Candidatus Photodesmus blepharus]|uniref:Copper transport protein n=1 Tax=Candidatus Photodesmus blepharonis TaxID=1179155 RepID=A0A084CMZ8_9GAMM|nr:DUF2788 domain-containing protein [Candidatus Photodesmus blepharus]KEY91177.1 copper transport protein [Candidatus Photodesmus blepharus]
MLYEHIGILESLGLGFLFVSVFFLIGMAIKDLLKSNVSLLGRSIAWLVLFLGCAGFALKGIIQLVWENSGLA